ncbi:MAG: hypothetical protein K6B41_15540 [Butyrivibrio sp.]|nr:hypothetical protein [Butyrivibrio sp.]
MNYKKFFALILSAAMAISVVGCNSNKKVDTPKNSISDKTDSSTILSDESDINESRINEAVTEAATTYNSVPENISASLDTTSSEDVDTDISLDNKPYTVENNGNYFLHVGDYIYYRIASKTSLNKNALWGEFLTSVNFYEEEYKDESSEIWRLNLSTNESEKIADDFGYGPLFSDGTYIYLNEHDGLNSYVTRIALDGTCEKTISQGQIEGLDAKSGLLAISYYEKETNNSVLSLYNGTELINEDKSNQSLIYSGITSDGAFYMICDYSINRAFIFQLAPDTEDPICLGTLQDFETGYPNMEQFWPTDDGIYFVVSELEGTMLMVSNVWIYKASSYSRDDITDIEIPAEYSNNDEAPIVPVLYTDENGSLQFSLTPPNTPLLGSFEEGGDLMLAYEKDEYTSIIDNYRLEPEEFPNTDYEYRYIQQAIEYIDENIFLIVALAHRDSEYDVGWRESYSIDSMEYIRIDSDTKKDTILKQINY